MTQHRVTYGTLVVDDGTTAGVRLVDKFEFEQDEDRAHLEFDCIVQGDTVALFLANEAALISAFGTDRQDLLVEIGETDRHDFQHAANTGFNAKAICRKVGSEDDTSQSARYRCRVEVGRPAPSARAGRRIAHVSISKGVGRIKRVRVVGTYTALDSNSARTQYEDQISTYVQSVIEAAPLSGTFTEWELIHEDAQADNDDKVLEFEVVYKHIKFNQAQGTLNHASLYDDRMEISIETVPIQGSSTDARPPAEGVVNYAVNVDSDVTTDLRTIWIGTILPQIKAQAAVTAGGGRIIITGGAPVFHWSTNQISAQLRFEAYGNTGLVTQVIRVEDDEGPLADVEHVWNAQDPYAADIYQTLPNWDRVVTARTVRLGQSGRRSGPILGLAPPSSGTGKGGEVFKGLVKGGFAFNGQFIVLRRYVSSEKSVRGIAGSNLELTIENEIIPMRRVNPRQRVSL